MLLNITEAANKSLNREPRYKSTNGSMTTKGLFIALEGGDYSGKGTQSILLARNLLQRNEDLNILLTHEPTAGAREIKQRLATEHDPYANALRMAQLYTADREEHTACIIRPSLHQGIIVIANRYKLSTCCYQSVQGVSLSKLIEIHNERRIPAPDITIVLDIAEETAEARASNLPKDKFEANREFRNKVYSRYRNLAALAATPEYQEFFGPIAIIDGNGSREEVATIILEIITPRYRFWLNPEID